MTDDKRHRYPPRANWVDERQSERGNMRVQQAFATLRADHVYEQATVCAACQTARQEGADPDALCEAHLAQALGMGSEWL